MRNTHCLHCGKSFEGVRFNLTRRKFCGNACRAAFQRALSPTRFWSKVDKGPHPKGCWVWTGYCQKFGHGWLGRGDRKGGSRGTLAHRYAWELLVGPVAADKCLLHHCDNPPCVNPSHLYIGDRADNVRDKVERGKILRGQDAPRAKLTDRDVIEIRRLKGKETCLSLSARFGVNAAQISQIQNRKVWRHLP